MFYFYYLVLEQLTGLILLSGSMQVLKNNEFEFVEIPFELSNADTVDKDIGNRYTKSTENIIYISQNLYQKIINQCIPDASYQSNVYILKINSYKNIQAVTDFIKKHDQQIKVYNPVSSTILNQTTSFGFEMIYNFSKIIFILFVLSCFIIGIFDVVTRRYQYALLLVNGFNKKQCLKLILKERINYCLLSIVLAQVSVMGIFYLQYHTLASIIIERALSVLMIVNLIILFVPCVTFIILMKINHEGNMLKTSEVITMKKVPVFVVLIGCVFSWLIASMNPVTKIIDQSVYSYFNYQLMAIGIAISLFVGIILLWFIKRKEQ